MAKRVAVYIIILSLFLIMLSFSSLSYGQTNLQELLKIIGHPMGRLELR